MLVVGQGSSALFLNAGADRRADGGRLLGGLAEPADGLGFILRHAAPVGADPQEEAGPAGGEREQAVGQAAQAGVDAERRNAPGRGPRAPAVGAARLNQRLMASRAGARHGQQFVPLRVV